MILYRFEGEQLNPQTLRYTVVKPDGVTPYIASEVTSLVLHVTDLSTLTATTPTGGDTTTVVATAVAATRQQGNVTLTYDGSYFPQANRTYRLEAWLTPVSGAPFVLGLVENRTQPVYSTGV